MRAYGCHNYHNIHHALWDVPLVSRSPWGAQAFGCYNCSSDLSAQQTVGPPVCSSSPGSPSPKYIFALLPVTYTIETAMAHAMQADMTGFRMFVIYGVLHGVINVLETLLITKMDRCSQVFRRICIRMKGSTVISITNSSSYTTTMPVILLLLSIIGVLFTIIIILITINTIAITNTITNTENDTNQYHYYQHHY